MEYISSLVIGLLSQLTDKPDQLRMLFVLLVAAAVFLFGLGIVSLFNALSHPLLRRLSQVGATASGSPVQTGSLASRSAKAIDPFGKYLLPKKEAERSRVSRQLLIAGYRSPHALSTFYTIKTLGAVLLPVFALIGMSNFPDLTSEKMFFYTVLAGFVGVSMPNFILNRKVEGRQKRLRHAFPDALDLLVVCIEAGLGLNSAIQRVARELRASYPDLAYELELINVEIRAGIDRSEALRNLVDRTGLDDIRGLVSLLTQSLRFGTSIADTLRIYAEEFRDKRMQLAEEQAAKIGTKLLFPMIFCLFPSFFLVAIGPAIIRVMNAFSGGLF